MNMELVYKQLDELLQMGRIEETEDFLIAAMGRAQQEGDYNSLIALLNEMTGYQKETGKPDKAVAYGAQAIELMKQLGMSKSTYYRYVKRTEKTRGWFRALGRGPDQW